MTSVILIKSYNKPLKIITKFHHIFLRNMGLINSYKQQQIDLNTGIRNFYTTWHLNNLMTLLIRRTSSKKILNIRVKREPIARIKSIIMIGAL